MTETRRTFLARSGSIVGAGLAAPLLPAAEHAPGPTVGDPFGICLNTATIRAHKLGIVKELGLAAKAGYRGVEPWVDAIDAYERAGGSLADLRKRAEDLGLELPNAVAFFDWMAGDPARRARGLEEARRRMAQLAAIGCRRIAAPPAGAGGPVDLLEAAERYRALLEIGDELGVVPALEIWGSSPALSRLGQAACIAVEARHPKACIIPDVFHLHRGGSGLEGVRLLAADAIAVFHINDYPDRPPEELRDSHRVFPGDGVAPLGGLFRDLRAIGYRGMLSLELFNPEHARRDPEEVVREGLEKTRAVLGAADLLRRP